MKTVIFKVKFTHDKRIWRKLELKENQTLVDLHEAVQDAIGWTDPHLYSFFMSGKAWDRRTEYTSPEQDMNFYYLYKDWYGTAPKTADIKIRELNLKPKQKFLYLFDFGDEWHFGVEVVGFGKVKRNEKYPKLVESKGEAPPQYPDVEE